MSIRCERYIGYSLDIIDEINNLSEEQREQWLYGPYSVYSLLTNSKTEEINDNILVVYDGLNGSYCKLFYVVSKDTETFYDSCEVDEKINDMLKLITVDMEIKHHMRQAYKTIFGKELEHASLIRAEYLMHYC